ncbi:four-carbon acid sugar kinase family protein [Amycolatopsis methanolica]|uniref:four-carbon acid sugar kinase family protein n=1 Tax=Amycolatopsis methanolica TaxID=1814 RepID=UPI0034421C74
MRDLPVRTRWTIEDVRWALRQDAAGFFVLTNTRSLAPADAAARDREVVTACLKAAEGEGVRLAFASRSDSTLRGHFPLETDVIGEVLAEQGDTVDAVVLAPAFTDAGRVTIHGTHYLRSADGLTAVADTEFAKDATFGFTSSRLAWPRRARAASSPRRSPN